MAALLRLALLVPVLALVGACELGPPEGPHALWSADAASTDNPFPDARLVVDGRVALRKGYFEPFLVDDAATFEAYELFEGYADRYAELEGFGAFAPFFVRLSARVDDASDLSAHLFLLGPDDEVLPVAADQHPKLPYVRVQPLEPMAPGAGHTLVLLDGLFSEGAPLVRSPDFWTFAREDGEARVAAAATRLDVAPERVLLLVETFTRTSTTELVHAAETLLARAPDLTFDAPDDDRPRGLFTRAEAQAAFTGARVALDAAGTVGVGILRPVQLRDENMRWDLSLLDEAELPVDDVEIIVVEPDPTVFPPPWPAVIAQHGFNGDNRFVVQVAETFNAKGFAVLGIDAVSHGQRGSVVGFFNVEDVRVPRDNIRQTALDLVQLRALVAAQTLDIDGVPGPDLTGEAHYFGHSMGAIIGSLFTAVTPDVTTAVLNAPGGGITQIFESEGLKAGISLLALPALGIEYGSAAYDDVLPFFAGVTQGIFGDADPINYARMWHDQRPAHAPTTPRVLVQIGVGDRLVPNSTTDHLVRAVPLEVLDTSRTVDDGQSAAWRVVVTDFGVAPEEDPHDNFFFVPGIRTQAAEFVDSHGAVVHDPATP
jgi:pimeloyl-ACP methyl ester carboxylesterase